MEKQEDISKIDYIDVYINNWGYYGPQGTLGIGSKDEKINFFSYMDFDDLLKETLMEGIPSGTVDEKIIEMHPVYDKTEVVFRYYDFVNDITDGRDCFSFTLDSMNNDTFKQDFKTFLSGIDQKHLENLDSFFSDCLDIVSEKYEFDCLVSMEQLKADSLLVDMSYWGMAGPQGFCEVVFDKHHLFTNGDYLDYPEHLGYFLDEGFTDSVYSKDNHHDVCLTDDTVVKFRCYDITEAKYPEFSFKLDSVGSDRFREDFQKFVDAAKVENEHLDDCFKGMLTVIECKLAKDKNLVVEKNSGVEIQLPQVSKGKEKER